MRLKVLFTRVYSIIIVLLIIMIISSILMYLNNNELVKSNKIRYKSYKIAEELRKSSDDLTTFCRTYVQTGDSIWKNKYFEVLDIRDGKRTRADGALISLQDSMKKLGFTNAELNKLKEAEKNSNTLATIEKVSINALKGIFADNSGQFTIKGKPDSIKAHRILYDENYLQSKRSIMKPIDECIKMVEERTKLEVEENTKTDKILLFLIIAVTLTIILFVFISFFTIDKKITGQFDELQKAKANAEQNEEKFKLLFDKSPEIIILTTMEGELLNINPAGLKFHGVDSMEELRGVNVFQFYVNPNERTELIDELNTTGNVRNKEVKLTNIKGSLTIDSLISCELIKSKENQTRIISWIRDISEKIKTERTILKLSAAVSQNPAAIVITDIKGKIEYVNQQFSIITGYSYEESIGCYPRILKSGVHPREFYKNMWNTILSGNTWNGELYNKRKDGSLFWEATTIAPILNNKKEIINIVAIKQDVTAKKLAEIALVESQKKLKELNDTKNMLFSIIGHDLRGPIGNLKSFIELIIDQPDYDDTQQLKRTLQVLLSSTTTTFELLENLLLWAKSQQNEVVFLPENFDLHQIVEMNMALVSGMAKNKDITIQNQIPVEKFIHADKNMIMTVIRNLITNAIKFTERGKNIYLSLIENSSSITISIKDEGVGIAPNVSNMLFNSKEHYTTIGTSGEKGTGLGLLLCKDFIKRHNGKIWVESEIGKGSEFKFTIPNDIT